jgi:competence protein ComEA
MKKIIKLVVISASLFLAQYALASQTAEKPAEPAPAVAATAKSTQVNINTADAATLSKELNGIGEVKAKAIVDYRTQNGPFKTVEDLANVTGIGAATIEKNKSKVVLQ